MVIVRASYEEALQVPCPECDAQPPNPCTYLPLPASQEHGAYSARVRARIALTGTPTVRPHNGRFTVAWERKVKRHRQQLAKNRRAEVGLLAASPELRAIARAHQQWDRTEWLKLSHWLKRWGQIFEEDK